MVKSKFLGFVGAPVSVLHIKSVYRANGIDYNINSPHDKDSKLADDRKMIWRDTNAAANYGRNLLVKQVSIHLIAVLTLVLRSVVMLLIIKPWSLARWRSTVFALKGSISADDLTFKTYIYWLFKIYNHLLGFYEQHTGQLWREYWDPVQYKYNSLR